MEYTIRPMRQEEYPLLRDFLYEAIFIPEGAEPPPRSIIDLPELQVYIRNFGSEPADFCFVADAGGRAVGAVWVRIMNDYGHIADDVPSFAISLYENFRSMGIGTALMHRMLAHLREKGFARASLAVQKANFAVKLYENVGSKIIDENAEEYIMVCDLP